KKVTCASNVSAANLIVVVAPTASIAGLTQVAGRVVEVGIHKLRTLGLSPKVIRYAMGYAPIPPLGTDFCTVDHDDEAALKKIIDQAPSMASKEYGKPFLQIFREADKDFYKIDH